MFMTYLFSWIVWGILYASDRNIISHNICKNCYTLIAVIGASMPSIMSIIFTGFFYGSDGIKKLLKRITIWKINPLYYIYVLFIDASIVFIPLWICNITGSSYKFVISTSFNNILLDFLVTILFGGPLQEEFGWRGYVLPKLQNKLNPIYSSIILGVFWACWHLPLFFIHNSSQYGTSFSMFFISAIGLSILFTWVYNRTDGSLLLTIIFHTAVNVTPFLYGNGVTLPYFYKSTKYTIIKIIFELIILLFVIFDMNIKPKNQSSNIKNHANV
jgi:membrane protease YdiL (CAAX protease family)